MSPSKVIAGCIYRVKVNGSGLIEMQLHLFPLDLLAILKFRQCAEAAAQANVKRYRLYAENGST